MSDEISDKTELLNVKMELLSTKMELLSAITELSRIKRRFGFVMGVIVGSIVAQALKVTGIINKQSAPLFLILAILILVIVFYKIIQLTP